MDAGSLLQRYAGQSEDVKRAADKDTEESRLWRPEDERVDIEQVPSADGRLRPSARAAHPLRGAREIGQKGAVGRIGRRPGSGYTGEIGGGGIGGVPAIPNKVLLQVRVSRGPHFPPGRRRSAGNIALRWPLLSRSHNLTAQSKERNLPSFLAPRRSRRQKEGEADASIKKCRRWNKDYVTEW